MYSLIEAAFHLKSSLAMHHIYDKKSVDWPPRVENPRIMEHRETPQKAFNDNEKENISPNECTVS